MLFIFKLAVATWYSSTREILYFDFVSLDLWHEVLIKLLFHFFCFIYYMWLHFKQRCYFLCCREKELAAVKIKAVNVDIIANELEVSASYLYPFSNIHMPWLPKAYNIFIFQYLEQIDPNWAELPFYICLDREPLEDFTGIWVFKFC